MSKQTEKSQEITNVTLQKSEMADAHCHIDMFHDMEPVRSSIQAGVLTIIADGISASTNKRILELCDRKNIFPALGMDPETVLSRSGPVLETELRMVEAQIKAYAGRVVSIGEIGLDYKKASDAESAKKQKRVFVKMLDLALEANLPVSVHSRLAMADVLDILKDKKMKRVQLHFFEGNLLQAKEAERAGYMISIPPLESEKRKSVIREVSLEKLLVESDSPAVGASPKDVEISIRMVAEAKRITFEKAAEALTLNTKRFFNIHPAGKGAGMMRSK